MLLERPEPSGHAVVAQNMYVWQYAANLEARHTDVCNLSPHSQAVFWQIHKLDVSKLGASVVEVIERARTVF